jgi:hypothetical protein
VITSGINADHAAELKKIARREGVHEIGAAEANPAQRSDEREGSASPSVEARGTSTTPLARSVAAHVKVLIGAD